MIHIIPLDDLIEHQQDTACPCNPTTIIEPNQDIIVIHNALDNREELEAATLN